METIYDKTAPANNPDDRKKSIEEFRKIIVSNTLLQHTIPLVDRILGAWGKPIMEVTIKEEDIAKFASSNVYKKWTLSSETQHRGYSTYLNIKFDLRNSPRENISDILGTFSWSDVDIDRPFMSGNEVANELSLEVICSGEIYEIYVENVDAMGHGTGRTLGNELRIIKKKR